MQNLNGYDKCNTREAACKQTSILDNLVKQKLSAHKAVVIPLQVVPII